MVVEGVRENLDVIRSGVLSLVRRKGILGKTDGRCALCGRTIGENEEFVLHDVIPYNVGATSNGDSIVGVCESCSRNDDLNTIGLEDFKYINEECMASILEEYVKFRGTALWYDRNNLLPSRDIELKSGILRNVRYNDEGVDKLTRFIERYNEYIGLKVEGEEPLVEKFFRDGRFYCLCDEQGEYEMVIPVKPFRNPKGYFLHMGNIMIEPSIAEDGEKAKLFYKVVKEFTKFISNLGKEPMFMNIVVACNSKDKRSVEIVEKLSQGECKVAEISPGYSLCQYGLVCVNTSFKVRYEEVAKSQYRFKSARDVAKSKLTLVKNYVKEAEKTYTRVLKLYISSSGGTNYEDYVSDRYWGKEKG